MEQDLSDNIQKISDGFKIVSMKMKNATTGKVLWECDDWNLSSDEVKDVRFPIEMLSCESISREIVFKSEE